MTGPWTPPTAYPSQPRPGAPAPSKTMAGWSLGLAIFGCAWAVVGVVILATGVLGSVQLPLDPAGDDGAPGRDGPTGRTTACADVRVGDC